MAGLLAAFQFLTILPIKRGFSGRQIGQSTAYFPLVGLLLGLILVGINYLLNFLLPSGLVNILLLAILVVMTGGLHLDGLADTIDGMAGHRTSEQRLAIMRDSRIGAMGAVGLALFLLAEYLALNSIGDRWLPYTLVVVPVVARWAMVNCIFHYPYARADGLGTAFKQAVNWQQFWLATLITIALAAGLFRLAGLAVMAFTWLAVTLAALYFKSQIKGLTGDTYGAINEIGFTASLLALDVLMFKGWLL